MRAHRAVASSGSHLESTLVRERVEKTERDAPRAKGFACVSIVINTDLARARVDGARDGARDDARLCLRRYVLQVTIHVFHRLLRRGRGWGLADVGDALETGEIVGGGGEVGFRSVGDGG